MIEAFLLIALDATSTEILEGVVCPKIWLPVCGQPIDGSEPPQTFSSQLCLEAINRGRSHTERELNFQY